MQKHHLNCILAIALLLLLIINFSHFCYSDLDDIDNYIDNDNFIDNDDDDYDGEIITKFVRNEGDLALMNSMLTDGSIRSINVRDKDYFDITAIMYQTAAGTKEAMEWLLTRQPPADINLRDKSGGTALLLAVDVNSADKVRLLLEHGADREIRDLSDMSPLDYAKEFKLDEIITILETYFPNNERDL